MTSPVPYYVYPGQIFDEIGSLAAVMPQFPRLAFDIATSPGSTDVSNVMARAVMQSGHTPYEE